jgi:FkbM family methyltransferase
MIRQEKSGWFLPADDTYCAQFFAGQPPKRNGFYREHLQAALTFVKAWDCAIDVGAHCGFWTWDMAQRFKTVKAFEPVPSTFQCLIRNVAEFDNVICHNLAVGHVPCKARVRNDKNRPGNSGSNYMVPDPTGDVSMITLDELNFPACDFLKIDVEGFELRVLEGARQLLKRCKPVISMECTDWKFRSRYDIQEGRAERWLLMHGYRGAWASRPDKVFVPDE